MSLNVFLLRCANYVKALKKLYSEANVYSSKSGRRLLDWDQIQERLDICHTCEHFNGLRCDVCGCCTNDLVSHFNKLAFPTEECPDTPPRWEKVENGRSEIS